MSAGRGKKNNYEESVRSSAKKRSCHVLSCLVMSCRVVSCLVLSCLVLSCLVLSCLVLSCLVMSCLVLSYLHLSSLILSWLVFCYLGLTCFVLSCQEALNGPKWTACVYNAISWLEKDGRWSTIGSTAGGYRTRLIWHQWRHKSTALWMSRMTTSKWFSRIL